ncbi:MAG: hypothetical protein DHS20C10_05550 [marine bacterium B5-7]|nr:MAG: hypothetical protein DHS20C10_05550 [marine bacterium B5-7]
MPSSSISYVPLTERPISTNYDTVLTSLHQAVQQHTGESAAQLQRALDTLQVLLEGADAWLAMREVRPENDSVTTRLKKQLMMTAARTKKMTTIKQLRQTVNEKLNGQEGLFGTDALASPQLPEKVDTCVAMILAIYNSKNMDIESKDSWHLPFFGLKYAKPLGAQNSFEEILAAAYKQFEEPESSGPSIHL